LHDLELNLIRRERHIAFVYGGQIWRVPAGGGVAVALTGAEFSASDPVWSPDSRSIAFSANRHGNADVFVMSAKGGEIKRLTTHSQADTPHAFSPDGKSVLFSSMRLGDPKVAFGGQLMGASIQLYSIPATGVGSGWSSPFRRSTRPGQDKLDQLSNWINV
jgi:tricorn protease